MANRVLLLTGNTDFASSVAELLALDGLEVATVVGTEPVLVVLADLDAWPENWNLRRLRQRLGRLPCLLLSGSPFGGPYAASDLARGYFLPKPFLPDRLRVALRRCISEE